jgi:hypothetical protein
VGPRRARCVLGGGSSLHKLVEGATEIQPLVQRLFAVSQPIVDRRGPSDKERLPPPDKAGNVRLTFLVSDGLYFGEGSMSIMERDAAEGPVISEATALLLAVVRLTCPFCVLITIATIIGGVAVVVLASIALARRWRRTATRR